MTTKEKNKMSDALIVAIIGQTVTLLIVFIQQWFSSRNLKLQLKNENKKQYYIEKRQAYKILIDNVNVDFVDRLFFESVDLTFFYKEVFLYASKEIINLYNKFDESVRNYVETYKESSEDERSQQVKIMGDYASRIIALVKKEFEDL